MSSRLDNLASYFNEKERARLSEMTKSSSNGLPVMTPEEIRLSCRENDGYDTPELNDKLYLHFRGYKRIENLDSYVGCKAIWLDSNGFDKIEGLSCLINLRCLYLGKNLISKIEGLENLSLLTTLDLSNNRLTKIENLACCTALQIVNFSRNALSTVEAISHLIECTSIENVDITHNNLDGDVVQEVFCHMSNLVALSINGNPTTQNTPSFRKKAITSIPKLAYLDRPIDELERLGAEAFISGGIEAEKTVKEEYRERQKQNRIDEMNIFREWQKNELERRKNCGDIGKRCYVSDFTEEERAQRDAEAKKAADDEKKMLSLGIGKIGARYWQLQGQSGSNEDILQKAVDSLLAEEEKEKQVLAAADNELPQLPPPVEQLIPSIPSPPTENTKEDESSNLSNKNESLAVEVEPLPSQPRDQGEEDKESTEAEESQETRDERVAESVRIYLHQQEKLREKREKQAKGLTSDEDISVPLSSTWDCIAPPDLRRVYWTEWMDLKLAEYVRNCLFDFALVASSFHSSLTNDEFLRAYPPGTIKHEEMKFTLSNLTHEDCRLRWAELDASRWSVVASVEGATDDINGLPVATASSVPVYRVCIQPEVLGKGHGAQPSFQAMSSMVAGSLPAYLKVPVSFPSTSEYDEGGEDDAVAGESLENLD